MKLISAKFQNFRLLRDLRLDFSTSDDKNLTVIRASNESGKTTILNALQMGSLRRQRITEQRERTPPISN